MFNADIAQLQCNVVLDVFVVASRSSSIIGSLYVLQKHSSLFICMDDWEFLCVCTQSTFLEQRWLRSSIREGEIYTHTHTQKHRYSLHCFDVGVCRCRLKCWLKLLSKDDVCILLTKQSFQPMTMLSAHNVPEFQILSRCATSAALIEYGSSKDFVSSTYGFDFRSAASELRFVIPMTGQLSRDNIVYTLTVNHARLIKAAHIYCD